MELIDIEKSIIKTYRKEIWSKFTKSLKDYKLVNDGDSIAVCISGGKDSFLLAKLFQELKRHGKINFNLEFIVMNPGYNEKNLDLIKKNSKLLNIPIKIFDAEIFEYVNNLDEGNPCYLCARMRRGYLYDYAKSLGCNKIALGHHYDDVIETTLMSMLYGAELKTMLPKLRSENFSGLELIRPMYLIREKNIINWAKYNELEFLNCACKFTEKESIDESARIHMKQLISELESINSFIPNNIFKSASNANLDALLGYKKDNIKYNYLDDYDRM